MAVVFWQNVTERRNVRHNNTYYERKRLAGGGNSFVAFFDFVRLVGTGCVDDDRDIVGTEAVGCLRFTTMAVFECGLGQRHGG